MVVVGRNLAHRAREGNRQFARRVVVAEQHVGDGVAALGAAEPGFQNRVSRLVLFENGQWAAVHQHQHQRFAGGFQRADQLTLVFRDVQVGAAGGFMRHATGFAHSRNDHVSVLGGFYRFVDQHVGRARVIDHFRRIEVEEVQVVEHLLVAGDVGATGVDQV
ncbi:hypothetical protein D3C72_1493160 [compost metagenome]